MKARIVSSGLFAASLLAVGTATARPPALAEPAAVSSACRDDARRHAACALVIDFFRSVNTRRYERACALLGAELRAETGGAACPTVLAADEGRRYAVRGVRLLATGTGVLVSIWFPELGHFRELPWLAVVAPERGKLLIVETRRLP